MRNTTNLGNDFKERLTDACDKFSQWMAASQTVLEAFNSAKESIKTIEELDNTMVEIQKVTDETAKELSDALVELENDEILLVDAFEIDLAKEGIDVSELEESIKPVKAIAPVVLKKNREVTFIETGNMILLMEDGTFKKVSENKEMSTEEFAEALRNPKVKKIIQDIILKPIIQK